MGSTDLTVNIILSAFLVFVRVSSFMMVAPFFSQKAFPVQTKLYFSMLVSIMLFHIIPADGAFISARESTLIIFVAIAKEALVGIALGLVGRLVMAGLEMAGSFISLNTGLSFANMMDPVLQTQNPIISNILNMLALIVFLGIEGDKIFITALAKSYQIVPAIDHNVHLAGMFMLEVATYLFVLGVQLTSPFLVAIFLMDVAIAIFARIMPQANMMFIALPLKMGIGIAMLMMVLPYLPSAFDMMFQNMLQYMEDLLGYIMPVAGP